MRVYPPQFGPRYIKRFFELDGETDLEDRSSRGGSVTVRSAPLPNTITNAQELAGGLTLEQLDQAAQMEVEEGKRILIGYGELLLGGLLGSHKYTVGPPKKNEFTTILGEGWGGLGRHGEWEGIVKAWYKGEELASLFNYTIYVDDALPAGATQVNGLDGWNWIERDPTPYFGGHAHQSSLIAGTHFHQFGSATQTMPVQTGDTLYCFVWLDPTNPPSEIMLQWQDTLGSGEHRAYWGADNIPFGVNGTNSRRQVSASVPTPGQWVRLGVAASQVGLEGLTVNGMAFIAFNGRVTWDQTGRFRDNVSTNPGYIFRPGIIATDTADIQHPYTTLSGVGGNGSANIYVRLTAAQSEEDRPDGLKVRVKCRRVFNFDATGAIIDYGYSSNPARVAADRLLHFYEQRYRNNIDLAREKFRARIFWPSWVEWRDNCDQLIPWNKDGSGANVFIKRFEANVGFNTDINPARMLDIVTGLSATMWQDTGAQLIFLPPSPRAPIHHFHPGNIIDGGINISVTDLRRRFNRFIARFRDIDDPFLGAAAVEPPEFTAEWERRQRAIARVRERRTEREFPNMTQSQGSRVITYRAQLEFHNPVTYSLTGQADAFKVLPGDFVTISHPEIERAHQLCLVIGIRKRSVESSADQIGCLLRRIDSQLYEDGAHRPRQEALTL